MRYVDEEKEVAYEMLAHINNLSRETIILKQMLTAVVQDKPLCYNPNVHWIEMIKEQQRELFIYLRKYNEIYRKFNKE